MKQKFDPQRHHRRSIRLKGYDYTQQGAYFVTLVTQGRECLFGEIVNGEMRLNEFGAFVAACWKELPQHFRNADLDEFVMMPNHLQGIVVLMWDAYGDGRGRGEALTDTSAYRVTSANVNASPQQSDPFASHETSANANASPLRASTAPERPHGTKPRSLNAIVQNFKSVTSRKINQRRDTQGTIIWQRDYFERVIRNENELNKIREYILNNPAAWESDNENPRNTT